MSHVVTVKLEVKDVAAIHAAAARLEKAQLLHNGDVHTYKMYGRQQQTGIGLQLEGWQHPVVIDTESGEVRYDNFGGSWGNQERLDEFVQAYSVEKVKLEALMHGHIVEEEFCENGDIKLKIQDFSS
jgi:hypothetical protein